MSCTRLACHTSYHPTPKSTSTRTRNRLKKVHTHMLSRIASRINKQKPTQKVLSRESAIAVKLRFVVKCTVYLQIGRRCYLLMCARFLCYFLLFDKEAIEEIPPPTVGWGRGSFRLSSTSCKGMQLNLSNTAKIDAYEKSTGLTLTSKKVMIP